MFGPVWPVKQWAGLGAVIGALFQLVQVMRMGIGEGGYAYASGRLIGGALVGTVIGVFVALIRNLLVGKRP